MVHASWACGQAPALRRRRQVLTKGVVIHGREDFRYEDVALEEPGEEEILVEVESCGVCAADPKIYHGTAYFSQVAYSHAPIVAGHEFMGRVVRLGSGAAARHALRPGDRAIAENIVPCWECRWCRRGEYNLCEPHAVFGVVKHNGGWARHMIYPKGALVHRVPENIAWSDAAALEPLACALHGVNRGQIQFGETVVVIGCGPIGLFMVQGARLKNPALVIAVDRHENRLQAAKELGADLVVNPLTEDAAARVKAETEDQVGCDVVLEAAGTNHSVHMAIDMLRRGGRLVEVSVFAEEVSLDWSIISDIKELLVIGSHLGFRTYRTAIDLMAAGRITARGITSTPFPLSEFREAIQASETCRDTYIKVLMRP
jgi:L-iditol 2-dehydrogenase